MRRGLLSAIAIGAVLLAAPGRAPAQQADEPVGWPLPKPARSGPKPERTPLLPVTPEPAARADEGRAAGTVSAASAAAEPEAADADTARGPDRPAAAETPGDDEALRSLVPLEQVTLGARPLVFSFAADRIALTADEVRLLERFASGVRSANGIIDVFVWVPPPADDDADARRAALERAFARGLYLRELLREAGIPAARIDILARLAQPPADKDMPSPPPAEGARIRLVSDFMTGVR